MKLAVIDLGTNTCNLLVAEIKPAGYQILHQSKQLVRLGDDKIKTGEISPEATRRVIDSFQRHEMVAREYRAEKIRIVATSAVRTATNQIRFLEEIGEKTGYLVKIISGEREAELIFKGILLAFGKLAEPSVILDIGGGSNETIIASGNDMIWKESRPTGMARVIHHFKISDPIQPGEIKILQHYFASEHKTALRQCRSEKVKTLIGCSGAFDTLADMIDQVNPGEKQRTTQEISLADFHRIYQILTGSTREQQLKMKGMDIVRIDLIVPAVILIEQLIAETGIQKIIQTDYALREGVLFEMIYS